MRYFPENTASDKWSYRFKFTLHIYFRKAKQKDLLHISKVLGGAGDKWSRSFRKSLVASVKGSISCSIFPLCSIRWYDDLHLRYNCVISSLIPLESPKKKLSTCSSFFFKKTPPADLTNNFAETCHISQFYAKYGNSITLAFQNT